MYWFDIPDELLPPVYSAIKDMYEYARTLDTQLREALSDMEAVGRNFFVQTCDLETIEYWEEYLDIELYGDETIDERRQMILLYMNNKYPTSEPYVRHIMEELFGDGNYSLEIDEDDPFMLHLTMYDTTYESIRRFIRWFSRMCPAHLIYTKEHIERANSELFVSSISPSESVARASGSVAFGQNTLYLGATGYTLDYMDL